MPQLIADINGADITVSLLDHKYGFEVIFPGLSYLQKNPLLSVFSLYVYLTIKAKNLQPDLFFNKVDFFKISGANRFFNVFFMDVKQF